MDGTRLLDYPFSHMLRRLLLPCGIYFRYISCTYFRFVVWTFVTQLCGPLVSYAFVRSRLALNTLVNYHTPSLLHAVH